MAAAIPARRQSRILALTRTTRAPNFWAISIEPSSNRCPLRLFARTLRHETRSWLSKRKSLLSWTHSGKESLRRLSTAPCALEATRGSLVMLNSLHQLRRCALHFQLAFSRTAIIMAVRERSSRSLRLAIAQSTGPIFHGSASGRQHF